MANPQSRAFIIRDGTETLKITQKSNSLRSIGESEPSLSKIMHSSVTEELLVCMDIYFLTVTGFVV